MPNTVFHSSNSRGYAHHEWLKSYHSFSFAGYYNAERMHFGALRVLNDDSVDGGMGFDFHPHKNMEIISIPLEGDLLHKDNMGNVSMIKKGDIQVMSAGTGVYHSEYNPNRDEPTKFLQIWIIPNRMGVEPRYQQITLNIEDRKNKLQQVLSPNQNDEGVWIYQDAWFYLGNFDTGHTENYTLKKKDNGVYVFVLSGSVLINDQMLNTRDGFGIWNTDNFKITTKIATEILLMEVPMIK